MWYGSRWDLLEVKQDKGARVGKGDGELVLGGSVMYRKRRRGVGVLVVLAVVVLGLGGGILYVQQRYTVKEVYVEGNIHYTKDEIMGLVMQGPKGLSFLGSNSLYLSFRYRNKGVENIPFVDVMDVSILAPDTIKITVYEKALAGYVSYLDGYMYFDKDGYVVESSKVKTAGVPQITGLQFDHVILGAELPVENRDVFTSIMSLTSLLKKYELTADQIFFQKSGNITIFFGEVKAALGNSSNLEDKLMRLPQILPQLEGKSGTLHLENVSSESPNATFTPDSA
jgi:cell division protein FtsQ